jgi:hypothetical protein
VSFIDQVTTAPIADIIEIESYARYNVLEERDRREATKKAVGCACLIF